ncbi:MAG: DUF4293 domain-containing protein [Bernardetiaceae bacterium]|jgi:hypothetical protein|nr:DUF4293 domain-containing protein [Bernardetiaceae bacterium]
MIQRIQTVFLFLVMVALVLMLFFPLWQKQQAATQQMAEFTVLSLTHQKAGQTVVAKNTIYLAIMAGVGMVLAAMSLFSYKNRHLQVRINLLNTLVLAVMLLAAAFLSLQGEKFFEPAVRGQYGLGFYMPGLALVFNALATRFIRRDEALVRSADRLR